MDSAVWCRFMEDRIHFTTGDGPLLDPLRYRVAIVDDDPLILDIFKMALKRWGFPCQAYSGADRAWRDIKRSMYRIVLTDITMPGKDGVWLLEKTQEMEEAPLVMMVTGEGDMNQAIHCLTSGAYDFLLKPVDLAYLKSKLYSAAQHLLLIEERARHQALLEEVAIAERWKSQQLFLRGIDALIRALEAKDHYTEGHSTRVAVISEGIGTHLSLRSGEINEIVTAARCHDIGKIGVSDAVLLKSGELTEDEFSSIKEHPVQGSRILSPIFRDLQDVILAVRHHHERFDGKGYPDGLSGNDIPLSARIICVADAFDAMTSTRVYREALSSKEAVEEIISNIGGQFCPFAAKGFLRYYEQLTDKSDIEVWKSEREEQRVEHRTGLKLEVDGKQFNAFTIDMAATGIQVESTVDLKIGQYLEVRLPELNPIPAKIKWISVDRPEKGKPRTMGLKLTQPTWEYLEYLKKIFFRSAERRVAERINQVMPVEVEYAGDLTTQNIINLSKGGLFIQTRTPLPIGSETIVRFSLPDGSAEEFAARAIVTHRVSLKEALQAEGSIPGMGVKFTQFFKSSGKRMNSYIDDEVRRKQKDGLGFHISSTARSMRAPRLSEALRLSMKHSKDDDPFTKPN